MFKNLSMKLSEYDPKVLLAIRKMHSQDRSVLEVDPLQLPGMLKDEGYLDYWPSLASIGAALDSLEIETGLDLYEEDAPR